MQFSNNFLGLAPHLYVVAPTGHSLYGDGEKEQ